MKTKLIDISKCLTKTISFLINTLFISILWANSAAASERNTTILFQNNQTFINISSGAIVKGLDIITIAETKAIFYATDDSIIYGAAKIIGAKVVRFAETSIKEESLNNTKIVLGLSNEFAIEKKAKDKSIERLHERIIDKALRTIYTPFQEQRSLTFGKYCSNNVVSASSFLLSANAKFIVAVASLQLNFDIRISKQKFYTSIENFQFDKGNTFLLRGPPIV